jgi:hypothetical protein
MALIRLSRLDQRGTDASSRTLRRDAMDADALSDVRCGMRTAKACGPGALAAGAKPRGMTREATVTQKPVSPGRARRSLLTPSRRECRCFGFSCSDYAHVLPSFAHEAMGAARHPAFPAPSLFEGGRCTHSGILCRGNADGCFARRHCEERSDEAIQTVPAEKFWIASRSLSSGRASRGPVGSQ